VNPRPAFAVQASFKAPAGFGGKETFLHPDFDYSIFCLLFCFW
jgi:hypothetical protein